VTSKSGAWIAPARCGENGACVFPVTTDDKVIGVLAFSGSNIREPDDRMLQAVDALRRSEMRFRVLNDLTSDWHWEQDSHCRVFFGLIVGRDRIQADLARPINFVR
jgi:hypothetical protein